MWSTWNMELPAWWDEVSFAITVSILALTLVSYLVYNSRYGPHLFNTQFDCAPRTFRLSVFELTSIRGYLRRIRPWSPTLLLALVFMVTLRMSGMGRCSEFIPDFRPQPRTEHEYQDKPSLDEEKSTSSYRVPGTRFISLPQPATTSHF